MGYTHCNSLNCVIPRRCEMSEDEQNPLARLLIVDDQPSIRFSMSHVMAKVGYDVRSAEDGPSALIAIQNQTPEILLCDLSMPGMSGFELLSQVRMKFPTIRTIAMSGAFRGGEAPSGFAADGFYQKGGSIDSLLSLLSDLRNRNSAGPNQATRGLE